MAEQERPETASQWSVWKLQMLVMFLAGAGGVCFLFAFPDDIQYPGVPPLTVTALLSATGLVFFALAALVYTFGLRTRREERL